MGPKPPLSDEDIATLSAFAEELAEVAGEAIRPYFRKTGVGETRKSHKFDPVTEADKGAERAIRELIDARYPDHGVLGEEEQEKPGDHLTWVIDPIDGTRAFITGLPLWGTLIALNDGTRPVIGIMNQPITGERFLGTPKGAWLNGEALSVRPCESLEQSILFSTDPDMFEKEGERAAFERVEAAVRLRRFGGDCYSYCMLAHGLIDLVIESDLQPYDIQALIPIVEGAGGIVTSWDGEDAQAGGAVIAAGDARVHKAALKLLQGK